MMTIWMYSEHRGELDEFMTEDKFQARPADQFPPNREWKSVSLKTGTASNFFDEMWRGSGVGRCPWSETQRRAIQEE